MNKQLIIDEINQLKEELEKLKPISKDNIEKLNKKFRLEFHYNTNHIEGNTLTYGETELLLIFDETRGNHTLREHEEMKGSDVAFELIRELALEKERPLTESFIKNINQILLVRPYWKDAITEEGLQTQRKITVGDYKKYSNSVLLENGEIFNYTSPEETPRMMGELLEWLKIELTKNELHPIELAAILHHKFVLIHPFDDGNGRISRLLLNYILFIFDFPPIIIKSADKVNYLRALRDADTGNIDSFIYYLANELVWSLQLSIKAAKNESIDELDDWKKNLHLLKRELDGSDEIKKKKSNEVLLELINTQIIPIGKKLNEDFAEIFELFLSNYFYITPPNIIKFRTLNELFSSEIISEYSNGLLFAIQFKEFRKKIDRPFDIDVKIKFVFNDYMYSAGYDNSMMFTNLYHKKISETQIKELTNKVASDILLKIEQKLK